jgi:hypothetical protein
MVPHDEPARPVIQPRKSPSGVPSPFVNGTDCPGLLPGAEAQGALRRRTYWLRSCLTAAHAWKGIDSFYDTLSLG